MAEDNSSMEKNKNQKNADQKNANQKNANQNMGKQYQRTDAAIIQAMIRLLKHKSFDRVTVQDLLDETPVSKGTFYAHFKDKYAVAEKMQETYMGLQRKLRDAMADLPNDAREKLTERFSLEYRDLVQALMGIHTEEVDIMRLQRKEYEAEYRAYDGGRFADLKAAVYADAMVTFQETYYQKYANSFAGSGEINATDLINEVMIDVFLHILKNDDNEKLRKLLKASLK